MFRKVLSMAMVLLMLITSMSGTVFAITQNDSTSSLGKLDSMKTETLNAEAKCGHADDDDVRIIVQLEGETTLERAGDVKSAEQYYDKLMSEHKKAIKKLENTKGIELNNIEHFTLLFNGFCFDGKAGDIDTINAMEGMLAYVDMEFSLPEIPEMSTSANMVNAPQVWDLDYTGKGMTVAIVDTGILLTHEAFSVMPDTLKYNKDDIAAKAEENASVLHAGTDADELYKSDKIPFAYDYEYSDYDPNHTESDHGTHVAGIAAGNNGNGFKGVAYDAQIFVMQVFKDDGYTYSSTTYKALEDCAYMGVDAVNMSLGSPCGYSSYSDTNYKKGLTLLEQTGVLVSVSAGNSDYMSNGNNFDDYQLTANPDNGIVGNPSTLPASLSVASVNNRGETFTDILSCESVLSFNEGITEAEPFSSLEGEHEYVYCGQGSAAEMPENVSGRIALIIRGGISFTDKAQNAAAAGAIGIIVYNNVSGSGTARADSTIPFITMSDKDGAILLEHMENGIGTLTVRVREAGPDTDSISYFSSKGSTSDLKIKPEISAPGGRITSSIGFDTDTSYATWSGTSMAAPHVAGGMTIVKEYVRQKMPNLNAVQTANVVNAILMGTAVPLTTELVEAQGSGMMNLENAVNTNVYITVNGSRPKLELDDSTDYRFSYSVELTNFGTESVTYEPTHTFAIDKPISDTINGVSLYKTDGIAMDVSNYVQVNQPDSITIDAGETVTAYFSIDASGVVEEYDNCFPSGIKLEGFLKFKSDTEEQSVPILGFLGDWDYASVFDRAFYWQLMTGEPMLMNNSSIPYNLAATSNNGTDMGIGFNPYVEVENIGKFNSDWGAISPNGDGKLDSLTYLQYSILRNLKLMQIDRVTPSGTTNMYKSSTYGFRKDFYSSSAFTYTKRTLNYKGADLNEGETAYIKAIPTLDHDGYTYDANENGVWVIPVTYDTKAPVVYVDNGNIAVYDEHYVAYTAVYTDAQCTELIDSKAYYEDERGITEYLNGYSGVVYVFVGDYAGNDRVYEVNLNEGTAVCDSADDFMLIYKVDGEIISQQRITAGDVTYTIDDPVKEGYDFKGWDKVIPQNMPSESLILNAVFEVRKYVVSFADYDFTILDYQIVEHGKSATAPEAPAHKGMKFIGWDKDFDNITEDIVVTAMYKYTGDANGDGEIGMTDAITLMRYISGWDIEIDSAAGDINGDGEPDMTDALLLLRYLAGWNVEYFD